MPVCASTTPHSRAEGGRVWLARGLHVLEADDGGAVSAGLEWRPPGAGDWTPVPRAALFVLPPGGVGLQADVTTGQPESPQHRDRAVRGALLPRQSAGPTTPRPAPLDQHLDGLPGGADQRQLQPRPEDLPTHRGVARRAARPANWHRPAAGRRDARAFGGPPRAARPACEDQRRDRGDPAHLDSTRSAPPRSSRPRRSIPRDPPQSPRCEAAPGVFCYTPAHNCISNGSDPDE